MYNTILLVNSTQYFYLISLQREFLIINKQLYREELSDLPFFLQTQLQQITVEEHIFGEFAIATLTFGLCTSPTENSPLA